MPDPEAPQATRSPSRVPVGPPSASAARYRKKPLDIDAVQWLGFDQGPQDAGVQQLSPEQGIGWILTEIGYLPVNVGDWIIREPDSIVILSDEAFQRLYDAV